MKKYFIGMFSAINRILPAFSIIVFSFFTICVMFFYGFIPGEAEAHAWTIAGNVNIIQLIDLMNVEGHFLLWYLCLMPFAKFPDLYPWVMYLINWIFCLLALYILWEKAPFNNFTKMCITFSAPFFKIYSIYPRCYAIGIFLLFLAMSFYNERLNKPYKYLICLTLAANTSAPACICAGILGIMFLYDLVVNNNNKVIYVSLITALSCLVLFYFQFHNVAIPDYEGTEATVFRTASRLLFAFLGWNEYSNDILPIKLFLVRILSIIIPISLWKNKHALVFFLISEISLFLFFLLIYGARTYHMFFFFIFLIIASWMFNADKTFQKYNLNNIILLIISLSLIFTTVHQPYNRLKMLYPTIISDSGLKNGNIYTNYDPIYVSIALPYLAKDKIVIYNMQGKDLNSYEILKVYFNEKKKIMEPDSFAENLDLTKRNFIVLNGTFQYNHIEGKRYKFNVKLYETNPMRGVQSPLIIYEVTNVKKL